MLNDKYINQCMAERNKLQTKDKTGHDTKFMELEKSSHNTYLDLL